MPHLAALAVIYGSGLAALALLIERLFVSLRTPRSLAPTTSRDNRALLGIALSAVPFVVVWNHVSLEPPVGSGVAVLALFLMLASVPVLIWAIWSLGAMWAIRARLRDDHRLITSGPYRLVRHPIYTALSGLLLAAGLLFSDPTRLTVAVVFYVVGTALRVQSEDRLLHQRFGAAFDAYRGTTPALFPMWRG